MNTLRNLLSRLRPIHPLYLMVLAAIYIPIFALMFWSTSPAEPDSRPVPAGRIPTEPPDLPEGDTATAPAEPVIPI